MMAAPSAHFSFAFRPLLARNVGMTPRRPRLLLFAVSAGLVALAVGAWLFWPRTAITRENAAKIQPGMTLAEVEAILGGPAREETTGQVTLDQDDTPAGGASAVIRALRERQLVDLLDWTTLGPRVPRWQSNHVLVWVRFDAEGRVAEFSTFPMRRAAEGPLDRLRCWLGR
jgi:hypothetical protein